MITTEGVFKSDNAMSIYEKNQDRFIVNHQVI